MNFFRLCTPQILSNTQKALTLQNNNALIWTRTLFSWNKKKNKQSPYVITRATKKDHDEILKEMYISYYPEEPVSFALGFRCDPIIRENVEQALLEGLSLVVKCRYNDEVIAAAINRSSCCWDPNLTDRLACAIRDPVIKRMLHFGAHIQRAPNLWQYYNVMKVFEVYNIFVRREERGKGIAKELIQMSKYVAADCGYTVVRIDATSFYLQNICENLKMHKVYELPYCSYVGSDGTTLFEPPAPHLSAKVYVDCEPQKTNKILPCNLASTIKK